jgi:anti-sigma28 factor (negative regulator of flagellin synthesis)
MDLLNSTADALIQKKQLVAALDQATGQTNLKIDASSLADEILDGKACVSRQLVRLGLD